MYLFLFQFQSLKIVSGDKCAYINFYSGVSTAWQIKIPHLIKHKYEHKNNW